MDEKMEIRLVNPTEDGFLQKIDWNKAELEANVRSIVEAYQGLWSNPVFSRVSTAGKVLIFLMMSNNVP